MFSWVQWKPAGVFRGAAVTCSAATDEIRTFVTSGNKFSVSPDVFTEKKTKAENLSNRQGSVTDDELKETEVWQMLTVRENNCTRGMRVREEWTHSSYSVGWGTVSRPLTSSWTRILVKQPNAVTWSSGCGMILHLSIVRPVILPSAQCDQGTKKGKGCSLSIYCQ